MRTGLSAALLSAMRDHSVAEDLIALLTATTPSQTLRFASHPIDVTSGGQVYTAGSFKLRFPREESGRIGQLQIDVANVDLGLWRALEALEGQEATIQAQAVLDTNKDSVEMDLSGTLRRVRSQNAVLRGFVELQKDQSKEPFPGKKLRKADGFFAMLG